MLQFLIFVLLILGFFLLLGLIIEIEKNSNIKLNFKNFLTIFMSMILIAICAYFAISTRFGSGSMEVIEKHELASFQNGNKIQGNAGFFLGIGGGSISSNIEYNYFIKEKDYIEKRSIKEDSLYDIRIKEKNKSDITPNVKKYSCETNTSNLLFLVDRSNCENSYYVFTVPKGTVKKSFNIDNK